MNFANPVFSLFFIVLFFLIIFYIWAYRKYNRDLETFAEKNLLPKIIDFSGQINRRNRWILRLTALFFLVLALTGPQWGYYWRNVKHRALEIIFALDTSKSMLATDIKPNRLERAKLALKDLIKKLPGDKVGLIAFSGTSFLQCPLTMDYNAFGISLDSLNTSSIPRGGTVIGEAIETARKAFKASSSGTGILILISDGENHEGDPVAKAKEAAKDGLKIFTIGIGSPEGELITLRDENGNSYYLKDEQGNVVKSVLNEKILQEIAKAGNGAYFRGTGPSLGLDDLYRTQLAKINKSETSSRLQKRYLDRYQIPLFIAFLLLLLEYISGTFAGIPNKKPIPQKY